MGGLGVKIQHFPLTLLVFLTTLTLPCERDSNLKKKLEKSSSSTSIYIELSAPLRINTPNFLTTALALSADNPP